MFTNDYAITTPQLLGYLGPNHLLPFWGKKKTKSVNFKIIERCQTYCNWTKQQPSPCRLVQGQPLLLLPCCPRWLLLLASLRRPLVVGVSGALSGGPSSQAPLFLCPSFPSFLSPLYSSLQTEMYEGQTVLLLISNVLYISWCLHQNVAVISALSTILDVSQRCVLQVPLHSFLNLLRAKLSFNM